MRLQVITIGWGEFCSSNARGFLSRTGSWLRGVRLSGYLGTIISRPGYGVQAFKPEDYFACIYDPGTSLILNTVSELLGLGEPTS